MQAGIDADPASLKIGDTSHCRLPTEWQVSAWSGIGPCLNIVSLSSLGLLSSSSPTADVAMRTPSLSACFSVVSSSDALTRKLAQALRTFLLLEDPTVANASSIAP